MTIYHEMPTEIRKYLNDRKLNDKIIADNKITYDGQKIVIPIFDLEGRFLYNKYRSNPFVKTGPKYLYDKGSVVVLYNAHKIKNDSTIFITEGEFDSLVLEAYGYTAVSSTGGAGTFKEEWVRLFDGKEVFLCYDSDLAGINGSIKTSGLIPSAKIVTLPFIPHGENTIKDVTDFFVKKPDAPKEFEYLVEHADALGFPHEPKEIPKTKTGIVSMMRDFEDCIDHYTKIRRELENNLDDTMVVRCITNYLNDRFDYYEQMLKLRDKPAIDFANKDLLNRAKTYPIRNLIRIYAGDFARCIWHDDANPSMKFYEKTNSVYCFVCAKSGDSIDVYCATHDVKFGEVIKILAGLQ